MRYFIFSLTLVEFLFLATTTQAHDMADHLTIRQQMTELQHRQQNNSSEVWLQEDVAKDTFYRELFKPMDLLFPKPDASRTATGRPSSDYLENRADYDIHIILNEKKTKLSGEVMITYHNNSAHDLPYLWLQLDQQGLQHDQPFISEGAMRNIEPRRTDNPYTGEAILEINSLKLLLDKDTHYGFRIHRVENRTGAELDHFIQGTMMRVDLPIAAGDKEEIKIAYDFSIPNVMLTAPARMGYQQFDDHSRAFYMMQFYPRMAYYDEAEGWDVRPYLGIGEFNLSFGDYTLNITAPANHVLTASGELLNPDEVLSKKQFKRLTMAKTASEPVDIVSIEEARAAIAQNTTKTKTWRFSAKNVRDVAFASSKRFAWQAMQYSSGPREHRAVLANSLYHIEEKNFAPKFTLMAGQHAINVFSRFTYDYPYPVINIIQGGNLAMEYPMLATYDVNQQEDGTYGFEDKIKALTIIIHEVGHNYAPMTLSPNERKWAWMDEGFTTFMHRHAMIEWSEAMAKVDFTTIQAQKTYMQDPGRLPIMTAPDNFSFEEYSPAAYMLPSIGLDILRETILGRELFDRTFSEFFTLWKFKHPTPYDFFRHIEAASGRKLNWFWRGWFYSSGHVDMNVNAVRFYTINTLNPTIEKPLAYEKSNFLFNRSIITIHNKNSSKFVEDHPDLKDFYDDYDGSRVYPFDEEDAEQKKELLGEQNLQYLKTPVQFMQIKLSNKGGIVMPVILKVSFADGSEELRRYSANIWRQNQSSYTDIVMMFPIDKEIASVVLDPYLETFDVDRANNLWARNDETESHRINIESLKLPDGKNLMQIYNDSQHLIE